MLVTAAILAEVLMQKHILSESTLLLLLLLLLLLPLLLSLIKQGASCVQYVFSMSVCDYRACNIAVSRLYQMLSMASAWCSGTRWYTVFLIMS